MIKFLGLNPRPEDYWRSIILFGRNVASYKFALAKSLIELGRQKKTFVSLEELAEPFSRCLIEHLKIEDKQTTSPSSKFLDICRQFNNAEISQDELITQTVKLGFNNVIDAFHNLSSGEIPLKFFTDERQSSNKGIILTDELLQFLESEQISNLSQEVEARWRLVETAWKLNLSRNLITVNYDLESELLFTQSIKRLNVTSCKDALNGYQKSKCFYCFRFISVESGHQSQADVDHFFPHILAEYIQPINGVWNLVLACINCNRGEGGKFEQLPRIRYLERLHTRNEFFISSHHPLRETLIEQTGKTERVRQKFLQDCYHTAQSYLATPELAAWTTLEYDIGF